MSMGLTIVPISLRHAHEFVDAHHRHHEASRGGKFAVGVCDDQGNLRGVATVGRPIARSYDDGLTAEVNRAATDGCPNANSALYGAAWRVCAAMGYRRMITYNEGDETGASLKAAGAIKIRDIPPRKGWADSSVARKAVHVAADKGGNNRALWGWGDLSGVA